ncbi:uncharacterized protein BJ171DRAFT_490664 [Polychytrium aggregatum]|uniref:uncharacterized protein n=1 Tax=Polychytrium aggregatum TaxID=110093 RepID=UPI0022FE4683|nr:uncharacterized protein BJ171DRAFT_490664 [Polychytrium aggregatum]KAI9208215.1 hypothetical protein BJ171DRAFT_490664 [Polychytrium aggregatum]
MDPTTSQRDQNILDVIFSKNMEFAPLDGINLDPSTITAPVIQPDLMVRLKELERAAVGLAEKNNIDGAIGKFSEAIELCPHYASAYNNRAQALRIKGDSERALEDLDKAIEHGQGQVAILKQAYTQRAIIKKQRGDEAGAEADFAEGARHGNEVAKQAVQSNPYAKMCNAIVSEAMAKLRQ